MLLREKTHRSILSGTILLGFALPLAAQEIATLPAPRGDVLALAFSPDGKILVSAGGKSPAAKSAGFGEVKLWNTSNGSALPALANHADPVFAVEFKNDGKLLMTRTIYYTRFFNMEAKPPALLHSIRWWNYDDERIVENPTSGGIRVWNAATGEVKSTLKANPGKAENVLVAPDESSVASLHADGSVKIWDSATGKFRNTIKSPQHRFMSLLMYSPDGKFIVTASQDTTLRLWEVASGMEATAIVVDKRKFDLMQQGARGPKPPAGHDPLFAKFSPDGKVLACVASNFELRGRPESWHLLVWDLAANKELGQFPRYRHVTFVGKSLVLQSDADPVLILVDTPTGLEQQRFPTDGAVQWSGLFDNNKLLVAATTDGTVYLMDLESMKPGPKLSGHTDAVQFVAVSADRRLIATGSKDKSVKLWDATTGQNLASLTGHKARIRGIVFSPDAKLLATADDEKIVKLWDVTKAVKK
ncbi:MAG TPA: WD40 repeat domain-containing protein [Gemmataceae bacterium]|nr:WD40 repeat domain-containing protein [Gemmataceae bacterium]